LELCLCGTPVGVTAFVSSSLGGGVGASEQNAIAQKAIQA
jgi:hypothetical protein